MKFNYINNIKKGNQNLLRNILFYNLKNGVELDEIIKIFLYYFPSYNIAIRSFVSSYKSSGFAQSVKCRSVSTPFKRPYPKTPNKCASKLGRSYEDNPGWSETYSGKLYRLQMAPGYIGLDYRFGDNARPDKSEWPDRWRQTGVSERFLSLDLPVI